VTKRLRVVLRADAGLLTGTGHVMRCLSLAEELMSRGHEIFLVTAPFDVSWLEQLVVESGVSVKSCTAGDLARETILGLVPDWVVVDSYSIAAEEITALDTFVPVLAVVDGETRGVVATILLDQNLGAEERVNGPAWLAGSQFALVRDAVLDQRRTDPWRLRGTSRSVLSFMGGTDPHAASIGVAHALAESVGFDLLLIAPEPMHDRLARAGRIGTKVIAPTAGLPALLGAADLVITAAGTSAWDVCALGIPSIMVAVVDNQQQSLVKVIAGGLALGVDAVRDPNSLSALGGMVDQLLTDEDLRRSVSIASANAFDGFGKSRVADRMEAQ